MREVNGVSDIHEITSNILLRTQKRVLWDLSLCVPKSYGPGNRSNLDIGQVDITLDLQHVHILEGRYAMGIVEEVLAIGVNLEAIYATADGQLPGEGRLEARARTEGLEGRGQKRPQTHIKEFSRTKRVVGDLLLLGSPRTIQEAVPNHDILCQTGVNVQSQVPCRSHDEVDCKAEGREGRRRESDRGQCLGLQGRRWPGPRLLALKEGGGCGFPFQCRPCTSCLCGV